MNFIKSLLSPSDGSGSRSTILKPLTWLLSILLASMITLLNMGLTNWFCNIIAGMIIITFVVLIFAFIYCLLYDRDALRSETFGIRKMEIENGFYGDSDSGYKKANGNKNNKSLNYKRSGGSDNEKKIYCKH